MLLICKANIGALDPRFRQYPVFERYIDYAARVTSYSLLV